MSLARREEAATPPMRSSDASVAAATDSACAYADWEDHPRYQAGAPDVTAADFLNRLDELRAELEVLHRGLARRHRLSDCPEPLIVDSRGASPSFLGVQIKP